jgi:hypothetical protein
VADALTLSLSLSLSRLPLVCERSADSPKSAMHSSPASLSSRFSGLRSRWLMPLLWHHASPSHSRCSRAQYVSKGSSERYAASRLRFGGLGRVLGQHDAQR